MRYFSGERHENDTDNKETQKKKKKRHKRKFLDNGDFLCIDCCGDDMAESIYQAHRFLQMKSENFI